MPGKPITESGLATDLRYIQQGISCHALLASICPPREGLAVIEPFAGSGKLSFWYGLRGARCLLVDIDPGVIAYSVALRERVEAQTGIKMNAKIVQGSVLRLERIAGEQADLCFCEGGPQHWSDWRRQGSINQMVKVTKPGGMVCIIGSNGHCPAMQSYALQVNHTYAGMPPRQKPWSRDELETRLICAGLTGVVVQPVDGNWAASMLLAGWGRKP